MADWAAIVSIIIVANAIYRLTLSRTSFRMTSPPTRYPRSHERKVLRSRQLGRMNRRARGIENLPGASSRREIGQTAKTEQASCELSSRGFSRDSVRVEAQRRTGRWTWGKGLELRSERKEGRMAGRQDGRPIPVAHIWLYCPATCCPVRTEPGPFCRAQALVCCNLQAHHRDAELESLRVL